jgi:hypothetical protein
MQQGRAAASFAGEAGSGAWSKGARTRSMGGSAVGTTEVVGSVEQGRPTARSRGGEGGNAEQGRGGWRHIL